MRTNIRGLIAICFLVACAKPEARRGERAEARRGEGAEARTQVSDSVTPRLTVHDPRPVILFVGTSLTAGLGVDPDQAYPALIQRKLDSLGMRWHAVNAGVSGETSAGALRRIAWLLRDSVGAMVLETGANDGLRGLDVDSTRANIDSIVRVVRAARSNAPIVLVGMEAPPNMGAAFTTRFHRMYPEIARRDSLPFVPFLLTGVAGIDSLNQNDGIHPTPRGHRIVADNVWRVLKPVLERAKARTGEGSEVRR